MLNPIRRAVHPNAEVKTHGQSRSNRRGARPETCAAVCALNLPIFGTSNPAAETMTWLLACSNNSQCAANQTFTYTKF